MNKAELVKKVVEGKPYRTRAGEVEEIVNATLDAIKDALANGQEVKIIGFGKFDVRDRGGRNGRNPQTGESVQIAACKRVRFTPGKDLKEAVNS